MNKPTSLAICTDLDAYSSRQQSNPTRTALTTVPSAPSSLACTNTSHTMASEGLFSADLLSPAVSAALPEGYRLRALRKDDFSTGFLDCLRVLTTVGEIGQAQFEKQYDFMATPGAGYYVIVIEDTNGEKTKVVATGALIVERKL